MAEERVLETIRKLLDRANHAGTPEHERDACIKKADTLMLKHAIDEALLDANKREDRRTPTSRTFHAYHSGEGFTDKFQTILWYMGESGRVRVAVKYNGEVVVVGMLEDVDYFEMMWTTIYLGFMGQLFPKWNDSLSFEHNVYNFKKAGFKWLEIRNVAMNNNHYVDWPDGGRLIRAYKKHAKMAGDEKPVSTQRFDAYRESYAEGFTRAVCSRLEALKEETAEAAKGSGAELALVDVQDRVNEAFYELYPYMRPPSPEEMEARRKEREERQEREARELQERLDAMTPKQRAAYDREQEAERRRQAKNNERYWRDQERESAARYDPQGIQAGKRAGEQVDLGGRGKVGGTTKGVLD